MPLHGKAVVTVGLTSGASVSVRHCAALVFGGAGRTPCPTASACSTRVYHGPGCHVHGRVLRKETFKMQV